MCVRRVRVDEVRDRFQTKTKHYNMIFSSVKFSVKFNKKRQNLDSYSKNGKQNYKHSKNVQ